ncbi:uncharacterized protein LOC144640382 [Oculina patagonica]
MERGGSLLITVLILQCIVLSLANQNLVPMFISEINTFLETDRDIVSEGSVFACVKRCAETSGCKSINYKKQGAGNNCYLNKKNRREAGEAAVETNNNFVHYDIDYHTQRSEEPEYGTTNIDMPVIPPIVIAAADASPTTAPPTTTPAAPPTTPAAPQTAPAQTAAPAPSGACDSNPCKNGGTCSEDGNGFQCSCANAFTGSQCDQPFNDFELIFRGTETTNYVTYSMTDKWLDKMTACAWIYTPGIAENQTMTVFSMMTDDSGTKKVVTEQIDGQGGFYFSFGADRNNHPSHFSSTSPKDSWIFLCVLFTRMNQQPYMEAIVNADFGSSASSNNFKFANVQMTKVVIGQDQNVSGNIVNTYPFKGKISALNIWNSIVNEWNMNEWYQNGMSNQEPLVKWPSFADPGDRVGNVRYVSITSAGKTWRRVNESELVINKTSNVAVAFTTENDGLVVEISQISSVACSDQDSAPVDGLVISVPGAWKRITVLQTFLETQQCYAIFGSVPSWASGYDPGVEEFDPNQDEIWNEKFLGANGGNDIVLV